MRQTRDLGDLVWFPVTSVKLAGLWVQVPHLQNELHFPVSEGHCGGNGDGEASGQRAARSTSTS